jgi:hypothetical protein
MVFYKLGKIPHKRHTAFATRGSLPRNISWVISQFSVSSRCICTLRQPPMSRIERMGELRPESGTG